MGLGAGTIGAAVHAAFPPAFVSASADARLVPFAPYDAIAHERSNMYWKLSARPRG